VLAGLAEGDVVIVSLEAENVKEGVEVASPRRRNDRRTAPGSRSMTERSSTWKESGAISDGDQKVHALAESTWRSSKASWSS